MTDECPCYCEPLKLTTTHVRETRAASFFRQMSIQVRAMSCTTLRGIDLHSIRHTGFFLRRLI